MKLKMKISPVLFFILFVAGFLFSCEDDAPVDEDERDEIIQTWYCEGSDDEFGDQAFESTITKDPVNEDRILISNFHAFSESQTVYAELDNKTLTLPEQTITDWTVAGTGTISKNYDVIDWEYTIDEGNGSIDATATYNSSPVASYMKLISLE